MGRIDSQATRTLARGDANDKRNRQRDAENGKHATMSLAMWAELGPFALGSLWQKNMGKNIFIRILLPPYFCQLRRRSDARCVPPVVFSRVGPGLIGPVLIEFSISLIGSARKFRITV
jgi:hypothetical protein